MEKTTMNVQELASQMGISLPKAYKLVKTPGVPCHSCRQQDSDPRRSLQGMAAQNFCSAVEIIT